MSDGDGGKARQRRLDALRGLASQAERPAGVAVSTAATEPATPQPAPSLAPASRRQAGWQRWRASALVIVAALVVVGVVVGAILRQSSALGQLGARPAPALAARVYTLQSAGPLSCPSTPAWSPDGKELAVAALVGASPSSCGGQYNSVTDIQQSDSSGGEVATTNGPPPDTFAIALFDATSGHVVRTIKLPELSTSVLCQTGEPCGSSLVPAVSQASLESIGWSPDGSQVAVFFTYTYWFNDQIHSQRRGVLIIAPANGSSAPRLLFARGRIQAPSSANGSSPNSYYSPPRFVWNLSTGAATVTDIQRGASSFTTPFARGYHLGAGGALKLDQQSQPGDVSPWRSGSLIVRSGSQGPLVYSYQTSQWLWSPNGRFVLPNLDTGAYVSLPGVTTEPPAITSGLIGEPTVAPPDAATSQSVKAAASLRHTAALARSPDGKLLAAYTCGASAAALTVRSIASGQTVAQTRYDFPLTSDSLGCLGDISPIAWSPDGARIASTDSPDGQIIVWQVSIAH